MLVTSHSNSSPGSRPPRHRRGVVLILILAMLSILALIGVTFATFSGQSQVGAKYFAEGVNRLDPETIFSYGINQLVNDSNNLKSAMRGHSLLRDAYGRDQIGVDVLGNPIYYEAGALAALPSGLPIAGTPGAPINQPPFGMVLPVATNIPFNSALAPQLYGANFTRWILRIKPQPLPGPPPAPTVAPAQTLEILADFDNGGTHGFWTTLPDLTISQSQLPWEIELDGRFQLAFNGSGVAASTVATFPPPPHPNAILADPGLPNFLFNGVGNPLNSIGDTNAAAMDEDYDAADLENWFLAIENAEPDPAFRINIPSFYRPGVISALDWTLVLNPALPLNAPANVAALRAKSKFLRPRAIDHPRAGQATFPDLLPDATTGQITYDVDNDGDGVTDSVWIDLGYPVQKHQSGKLYKPLFAFKIIGLNGKLPLNTVGNLAGRGYVDNPADDPTTPAVDESVVNEMGIPTFDHASHLGTSPSEINPQYAFRSRPVIDPDNDGVPNPGLGNFQVEMHRKLLTGDFAQRNAADIGIGPVAGRWGEEEALDPAPATPIPYLNPPIAALVFPGYNIRAGRSVHATITPDGRFDTQFNSTDFFGDLANPETVDLFDDAGGIVIPSERIRRFVLPTDPVGAGRIMAWNERPSYAHLQGPYLDYGRGFDDRGRAGYFMHFRPPGFVPGINDLVTNLVANPLLSHNALHGHESWRDPLSPPAPMPPNVLNWNRILFGAAPWEDAANNNGYAVPTYDPSTISSPYAPVPPQPYLPVPPAPGPYSKLPGGSLVWGEADQTNIYSPTRDDATFSNFDLEWLYRGHDVDGSSLDSRLARLGPFYPDPITTQPKRFFDPSTPQHNRLFSVDSFEPIEFAFANDNPGGVFPNNSRFNAAASASITALGGQTPPLAQGDRKINLNYPLPAQAMLTAPIPAATNPTEPTRLKWINETYALLKAVLPPKVVDHPEELAQLGQYAVNIIDFRDADDVMTIWTNPDVRLTATTNTESPRAVFANDAAAAEDLVHYGMEFQPLAISEVLAYSFKRNDGAGGSVDTPRFFLELVNTLTRNGANNPAAPPDYDNVSDIDLVDWDIVVVREDDSGAGYARPNPVTGQLAFNFTDSTTTPPPAGVLARRAWLAPAPPAAPAPRLSGVRIRSIENDGDPDYDVFGYAPPVATPPLLEQRQDDPAREMVDQSQEEGNQAEPRVRLLRNEDNTADGIVDDLLGAGPPTTPGAGYGNGHFHWLYLRRPADPHRPVQNDPTAADYNPFVVVDSMRFAYVESGGTGQMVNGQPQTVQGAQEIYSYQRFQPYRGGHAVPNRSDGLSATYSPANAYGYSEQIEATRDDDPDDPEEWYGLFEPTLPPDANNRVTRNIRHTLGEGSDRDPDPNDIGEDDDDWDGFVFFDRDFQSVAELLMVPVNPPGLFTKHFVEKQPEVSPNIPQSPGGMPPDIWIPPAPHANADGTFPYKAPPPTEPAVDEETGDDLPDDEPHSYPYLSDNFFYSGEGQDTADNATTATPPGTGPVAGGHTGAGWHRMLGFFEVPSSAVGAIGPLAKGVNRDWYREDVRPGQINLNLIVDEEVFFGLVDDPRMYYSNFNAPIQPPDLEVVTQADPATGNPTATVDLDTSRGFFYNDPAATPPGVPAPPATDFGANNGFMKPAFRDFLFNRHGNSGFLFGSLPPPVSPPAPVGTVYTERPFHDITYPDIFYTLFRPAATQENGTYVFPDDPADATDDPVGIKPYRDPTTTPLQPPAIHPRRLFEVPSQAFLAGPTAELNLFDQIAVTTPMPGPGPRYYLGNNGNNDFRRHPYFRTQLLQKLMNLSTVRTHQYAVWVTVGYFEVVQEGDPAKAVYNPDLAVDKLGREIGRDEGTAVRHRSFFILDRTRATGFSPANPVDFRDVVRYRRRIE